MRLKDQVALVTGGGKGLGRAIALAFAREGATIMIADKNAETAAATVEDIRRAQGNARATVADIALPDDGQRIVAETVGAFGRLDILVNNAGVGFQRRFMDIALADWERVIRINLTGQFVVSQAAARQMIAQGSGRIINMGSISGQRGSIGRGAYGAAKAGLMLLTKVMATELAPHGILVNAIAPGPIKTGISNHGPNQTAAYIARIPMGRYGPPEAVAAAAVYLASAECEWTTGAILNVDGGFGAAGLIFDPDEIKV